VLVELGTSGNPTADSCRVYNYYADAANPTSCAPPTAGSKNNGNVRGLFYQDSMNSGLNHTATYSYDGVNRLTGAVATGNSSYNQMTFTYDAYGNMSCTPSGPKCISATYNPATNQNTSFWYYPSGNVWGDTFNYYDWDNEGHMTQAWTPNFQVGGTHWYNALGQRVHDVASIGTTDDIYGADGTLLLRYTGGGWPVGALVPFNPNSQIAVHCSVLIR